MNNKGTIGTTSHRSHWHKILFLLLIGSSIFSVSLLLSTSVTANQLDVVDYPPYYGIYPGETQYYALLNRAQTTSLKVNISVVADVDADHTTPNMVLDVFLWDDYTPQEPTGFKHITIASANAETTFICELDERYLIKIKNLYTDLNDIFIYNISFVADPGVPIGDSGLYFAEQGGIDDEISVGFYYQADPWLYDHEDGDDRITLNFGWGPFYSELTWIQEFGERYFGIWNVYDQDVTLFVGVTGYPLYSLGEYPSMTIAVYDWVDMDAGTTEPLEIAFTGAGELNYSCGFNFTCKKGHIYEVYLKNDDSMYDIFANVTFYSWGQANIRFDDDLSSDPPSDEIKIRCYFESPWLEKRRLERETLYGWIFGTIGVIGLLALGFIIKMRYF